MLVLSFCKLHLWVPYRFYFLAMACGLIASLSLPPIGFFLGLFALAIPFYILGYAATLRSAFILGWSVGFGWFLFSLYWLVYAFFVSGGLEMFIAPVALLLLAAFLGVFWGLGFALSFYLFSPPLQRQFMAVIMLALAEYLRGIIFTGFPWNIPGLVLVQSDLTLAILSVVGAWGGSLLVLGFAVIPALLLMGARLLALAIIGVIGFMGLVGWYDRPASDLGQTPHMTARLVQPNIPQDLKWKRQLRRQHLSKLVHLSRQGIDIGANSVDLVIWPESAFTGVYERETALVHTVAQAASSGRAAVLMGILSVNESPFEIYNAAILFAPDVARLGSYEKRHLVPFGEYVPLRDYIPFVDAIAGGVDFTHGAAAIQPMVLHDGSGGIIKLLPLICYEIIFPQKVRRDLLATGADVIVNLTNDGWFSDTIGPLQHLAIAQMRAAELGVSVLRVANTGVTAAIDSRGRIIDSIDYGDDGFIDVSIDIGGGGGQSRTIYHRFGDGIFILLIFIFVGIFYCIWCLTRALRRL